MQASTPACRSGALLYVSFDFRAPNGLPLEASPWQRGRRYELRVSWDDREKVCNFEVPLRSTRSLLAPRYDISSGRMLPVDPTLHSECDEYSTFTLSPSGEPVGLISLGGLPSHVSVRILAEGKLFYSGAVSPRYEEISEDCTFDAYVRLE